MKLLNVSEKGLEKSKIPQKSKISDGAQKSKAFPTFQKSKHLYSIAGFLIALIISLPIYASVTFATLSNPSIEGIDEIAGYVKEPDVITISVNAEIEGDDEISASQLRLGDPSQPQFNDCQETAIDGVFRCSYTSSSILTTGNPFEVPVWLYDDEGSIDDDSMIIEGYKDLFAPSIISFTSSVTLSGNVIFDYRIEDYIYDGSSGKCVGIKELKLSSGVYNPELIQINSGQDNCVHEGSFSENIETITSLPSGDVTVEAIAYDAFGQQSSVATTTFSVDRTGPDIDADSFRIFNSDNDEIHYLTENITAYVYVHVSDPIGVSYVKADLTNLRESNGIRSINCNDGECIWGNVDIYINPDKKDYEIIINATDKLGNSRAETINYHLEFDNEPPIPSPIKTNYVDSDGNYYLGSTDNTIILEIEETGSGFNNREVYLNLRAINGKQNAQADECIKESDTLWKCYWYDVLPTAVSTDGTKQITVKPNSVDDLNNPIAETSSDVIVDTTAPVISGITYTPSNPTSSNIVTFNIKFSDASNKAEITIDSSSISTAPIPSEQCTSPSCSIDVEEIISSYTVADVLVTAEDIVGNKATREKQVTIYRADVDTTPNFFSVKSIEIIPSRIDRKVASLISTDVYVHVILQGVGSGEIISMTTDDCIEMANNLAEEPHLMNEYSEDPYIVLSTRHNVGSLAGNLQIKCKLRLEIMDGENIFTQPEIEDIEAELKLYGNALGNIGNNIEGKLEAINNKIDDVQDEIDDWEKYDNIFGTYCIIAKTMGRLNQAFQALKAVGYIILLPIYSVAYKCCASVVCAVGTLGSACVIMVATHAIWTFAICTPANIIMGLADGFFWPMGSLLRITLHWWTIAGFWLKIACMIFYYCAICDWNEIIDGIMGAGDFFNDQSYEDGDTYTDSEGNEWSRDEDGWTCPCEPGLTIYDDETFTNAVRHYDTPQSDRTPSSVNVDSEGTTSWGNRVNDWRDETTRSFGDILDGDATLDTTQITGRAYDWEWDELDESLQDSNWAHDGERTELDHVFGENYVFNPYKSIHYARTCMCLPAIIYNLEKDKQVKCMYRNCLTNNMMSGQSTTICEFAYKERDCLYVESAQYLKHGYSQWMDNLIWGLLNYYVSLLLGTVVAWACSDTLIPGTNLKDCAPPPAEWNTLAPRSIVCGLLQAAITWSEFSDIFESKFGFDKKSELKGPDYCEGG